MAAYLMACLVGAYSVDPPTVCPALRQHRPGEVCNVLGPSRGRFRRIIQERETGAVQRRACRESIELLRMRA